MVDPSPQEALPDELKPYVEGLLAVLDGDNAFKKAILTETLHLLSGQHATADMKMFSKVVHEVRVGLDVFKPYQAIRKVTVFGSARTPDDHPRYTQVVECARCLAEAGFMVITGGGGGVMQAANEGAGRKQSFGININLPLEQQANPVIAGSPRHFDCQYFFTRKLFFLKESDGVILAPGGFGTLDETFETLTLLQTGRNPPIPVVLLEAPGDDYWGPFMHSWMRQLVADQVISPDDHHLLYHTDQASAAVNHINSFYSNYHSFRYAGDWVVLRIMEPLSDESVEQLNAEFSDVVRKGKIEQVSHWPKSDDPAFDHLSRIRLHIDQKRMNVLPQLIRRINALYGREHE